MATPARNQPQPFQLPHKQFKHGPFLAGGGFGGVYVSRVEGQLRGCHSKYVATKTVSKAHIIKHQQEPHMISEKQVLLSMEHPFVVRGFCSYQDQHFLYLAMDLAEGGSFFPYFVAHAPFDEATVRFYTAQVAHIFAYFQERRMVYRDLKPENMLLDADGYGRLTDMGFAKTLTPPQYRSYTLCGTREYMAPEMLQRTGHGLAVDWWTLGIFIYELTCKLDPFFLGKDSDAGYRNIIQKNPQFPKDFPPAAKALVKGLLAKDPSRRLGVLAGNAADVLTHPYYQPIDFKLLLHRRLAAPETGVQFARSHRPPEVPVDNQNLRDPFLNF
eukprot:GDKJ01032572.1.p1 GENE.GDKJ01032572.1~~GDKJ01032572.1.p1  ORF type:complete len:328 (-),score=68.50 GDKJ01032572.1:1342-2325(-)